MTCSCLDLHPETLGHACLLVITTYDMVIVIDFPIMNIEESSQVTFLSIFQVLLPMLDTIKLPQPNRTFPEAMVRDRL